MNPQFCPNPRCALHDPRHQDLSSGWYVHNGYHLTLVVGKVQRYRCTLCHRTFSDRTFDIDYYTKRTVSYAEILHGVSSCASVSAIARKLTTLPNAVQNRIERLARNSIALHERLEEGFALEEDLVADGFESYDRSQYYPNNINLLVGKDSQYLYGFTHTTIRRKGRMTARQKAKREKLEKEYRAPKGGIEKSFGKLMEIIPKLWDHNSLPSLTVHTDEHKAYPRAIAKVRELEDAVRRGSFKHQRYSSKAERTVTNPLFAVNYYDRELRKDIAAHVRESTRFCRNVANGLSRLVVYQAWHNYLKPYRVRISAHPLDCHAVYAGIEEGKIGRELGKLCRERAFLSHLHLGEDRKDIWLKRNVTPLKARPEYQPKFALK